MHSGAFLLSLVAAATLSTIDMHILHRELFSFAFVARLGSAQVRGTGTLYE